MQSTFIGEGDFHDTSYDHMEEVVPFYNFRDPHLALSTPNHCVYTLHLYPNDALEADAGSNMPAILLSVVAGAFVLMLIAFLMFNHFVDRRNEKIVSAAAKFNSVIASLFPDNVRDRLFDDEQNMDVGEPGWMNKKEKGDENKPKSKAIADFFPHTTIMFADIVGFTAWSSTREPSDVFFLLETLYGAFDEIAKMRNVYKVETIGDCYVAVAGLPKPDKDHALSKYESVAFETVNDRERQNLSVVFVVASFS
jgi:hypothetical protein